MVLMIKVRFTSMEKQYHLLHALIWKEKLGGVLCLFLRGAQLQIFHHIICTSFTQHGCTIYTLLDEYMLLIHSS